MAARPFDLPIILPHLVPKVRNHPYWRWLTKIWLFCTRVEKRKPKLCKKTKTALGEKGKNKNWKNKIESFLKTFQKQSVNLSGDFRKIFDLFTKKLRKVRFKRGFCGSDGRWRLARLGGKGFCEMYEHFVNDQKRLFGRLYNTHIGRKRLTKMRSRGMIYKSI